MIVRMKEIVLFTTSRTVDETVQRLGELGVVDIKEIKQPEGKIMEKRAEAVVRTKKAIAILQNFKNKKNKSTAGTNLNLDDPKRLVERVLRTTEIRKSCQKKLDTLTEQLSFYQTWGENTNLEDFGFLRGKGIYLRLYLVDKPQVQPLSKKYTLVSFPGHEGKVPIALISQSEAEKLKGKEEQLPELRFEEIQKQIKRKQRQLIEIEVFLKDKVGYLEALEDYWTILKDQLGIQHTLESMGDVGGKLKYLKGYIPKDTVNQFKKAAQQQNWGYAISEPEKPEDVPVYIKNPKWIEMINPVMKFIDIVPGYKEVDVSIYFLVAFALFFAMLVGDAGYGAIFLLIALLLRKKIPGQARLLIYVLSGATIIWGVLSGTYFGSEQIAAIPFLNNLIIPNIASFGVDNISFMMHLSFLIGAVHLTIAHLVRCAQFINSIKALSEVGWIALVWGLFLITEQLVLGKTMPDWGMWLFIAGALLVMLFSVESKSFLKSMLVSMANLPLSLISGFSDIVSYVRLFAVGMATAAVAASFNGMILPEGISSLGIVELIVAAIALALGHGLNIALALMAVMVHGIRLNMLEFAGHLGVQFSGEAYKPFKLLSSEVGGENEHSKTITTG
ncbi:hypothetical protein KIM67_09310 [Flagellimonas sp. 389]|nr:V-type ATPase 116kDa subunit family protein [uncultured Allomuricauda sp.]MBS9462608.1 hypothetical protein [Flagellimonas sp. 389]